jgi:CBS domain-containing protein
MGLRDVKKDRETMVTENSESFSDTYIEALRKAEKEIIILTSSQGIDSIMNNVDLLKSWVDKNVKVKIMAPITSENLQVARRFAKQVEIKHINYCDSLMTLVDSKHLFHFKAPLADHETSKTMRLQSTIYTNRREYVQKTKEVVDWIWQNASDLSRVTVGSIVRMPVPTANRSTPIYELALLMSNHNIGAVIITRDTEPLGIVTERDIIRRVLLTNKNSHETLAQEIMTAPLITIHYDRTIEEALQIMQGNHVRRLVVLKGESMVGLLTERRLLQANSRLLNEKQKL